MNREKILQSNAYWLAHTQCELSNLLVEYMYKTNINKYHIAKYLGVKRKIVRHALKWKDMRLSEIIELSVKLGYRISFIPIKDAPKVK